MRTPLLLILTLLLAACPVAAQNSKQVKQLKNEQAALKKKIGESEGLLRSTKKDVAAGLANLRVVNTQIAQQQALVDGYQAEVGALQVQIDEQERTLKALEADLDDCKRKYHQALMYMFRNRAAQNRWLFILSAANFKKMYRRLRYVQEYSKYQRVQAEAIRKKEEKVKEQRALLLAAKKEKDAALAAGRAEQQKLETQRKERETLVAELNKKQSELQRQLKKQRSEAAALDKKIDALIQKEIAAAEARRKAEEAKRKAEEKRRAEAAAKQKAEAEKAKKASASGKSKASGKTSAANAKTSGTAAPKFKSESSADAALTGSFAQNRGRLPMPITGSYFIATHFGAHGVDGLRGVTLDSKGIDITGRAGAQARAVFDGEVSAIFSYGGLMNIIVRHGSYMSVYCNLSSVSVKQGAKVKRGQSLGPVAKDAAGNPTLHFQLRRETEKLNPELWLAK